MQINYEAIPLERPTESNRLRSKISEIFSYFPPLMTLGFTILFYVIGKVNYFAPFFFPSPLTGKMVSSLVRCWKECQLHVKFFQLFDCYFVSVFMSILWIITRQKENITIDEQLFPSKTRCPFTQFIPSKPDKYGQKFRLAVDLRTKYLLNAFPYLGKDEERPPNQRLSEYGVIQMM